MKNSFRLTLCAVALTAMFVGVVQAGRVSILVKGGKAVLKAGAKEAAERIGAKLARQAEEKLASGEVKLHYL